MVASSRYEIDIQGQPNALRAFAASSLPNGFPDLDTDDFDRIVLTGMGSSHFAAHRAWSSLVRDGREAWWVSTAQLLDMQELITGDSLLWVTSQSGESGEVVALLDALDSAKRPRTVLATTNNPASRLAIAADIVVSLESGEEASVSTKTYVTTLAAHERILGWLGHREDAQVVDRILAVADELENLPRVRPIASASVKDAFPRFVFVASSSNVSSTLESALVLKEAAKIPAEGFLGGEFRHGPLELAGPGLTAVLFGSGESDASLSGLGAELTESGARVVHVDPGSSSAAWVTVSTNATTPLGHAVCGAKFAQLLSVELALVRGIEPGVFRFGRKVTTSL